MDPIFGDAAVGKSKIAQGKGKRKVFAEGSVVFVQLLRLTSRVDRLMRTQPAERTN